MSQGRKNEERFLDKDERELVDGARHPQLSGLDSDGLRSLAKRLRERRDRAQSLDRRHVRAVRGTEAATEHGNRQKAALLSSAIAQVNKEFARRSDV